MTRQRKRLGELVLRSANAPALVEFYRDVLGLEIDFNGEGPYAEFKHQGIRFSMFERKELPGFLGQSPSYPDGLNGTFELAIELPFFDQVDVELERVVKAGATPVMQPKDTPWGQRTSVVADPEGNLIEIGSFNKGDEKE